LTLFEHSWDGAVPSGVFCIGLDLKGLKSGF